MFLSNEASSPRFYRFLTRVLESAKGRNPGRSASTDLSFSGALWLTWGSETGSREPLLRDTSYPVAVSGHLRGELHSTDLV
jgi:hypothetical protein